MKKLAIMCALVTTTISFQASAFAGSNISESKDVSSSCGKTVSCKHSEQIIADAKNFNLSGSMSEFLATEVQELKESAGDMSDEEAVSILVDFAHRTTELY